jgi:DNA repair protein RadC
MENPNEPQKEGKSMPVHEGHRERMKNRFRVHGLDNFEDHNVLELLLFYAIPRRDVNPLAHALIERFGSLRGVFEAPLSELKKVEELGDSAALLLSVIPQVSRRYLLSLAPAGDRIDCSAKAGQYLVPLFLYEREEIVYILCLDARRHLLRCREVGRGVVNAAEVSARRIAVIALEEKASGVIIAHNHLSGIALPSTEDEHVTRQIRSALALLGVELIDHIIVAGSDFVSMAESGILKW